MTIGAKLKELRINKKQSLKQVADAVGASKAHIWELETGRSSNPSVQLLQKLADHFEISIASLIGEKSEDLTDMEAAFLRTFKALSTRDQQTLMEMSKALKRMG